MTAFCDVALALGLTFGGTCVESPAERPALPADDEAAWSLPALPEPEPEPRSEPAAAFPPVVIYREAPAPPVVIYREVPAPPPTPDPEGGW